MFPNYIKRSKFKTAFLRRFIRFSYKINYVLLLTETNMSGNQTYDIPNFDCIDKYKRNHNRSGGVAIYHSKDDKSNLITPNREIILRNISDIGFKQSSVRDICSATCEMENCVQIVMVIVYISINQKMDDIKEFLFRSLFEYSSEVSEIFNKKFGKNYVQFPLILGGGFNISFKVKNLESLIIQLEYEQ